MGEDRTDLTAALDELRKQAMALAGEAGGALVARRGLDVAHYLNHKSMQAVPITVDLQISTSRIAAFAGGLFRCDIGSRDWSREVEKED